MLTCFMRKGKRAVTRVTVSIPIIIILIVAFAVSYVVLSQTSSLSGSTTTNAQFSAITSTYVYHTTQSTATSVFSTTMSTISSSTQSLSSTHSASMMTALVTSSLTSNSTSTLILSSSSETSSQLTSTTASSSFSSSSSNSSSSTMIAPYETQIMIQYNTFIPSVVSVIIGINNTVTWTNDDSSTHTVTSNTHLFDSGNLYARSSFSFAFTSPGTYHYICTIHPNMIGTIMVQKASG